MYSLLSSFVVVHGDVHNFIGLIDVEEFWSFDEVKDEFTIWHVLWNLYAKLANAPVKRRSVFWVI